MKDNLKTCLIVMSILIPGAGLIYSMVKNYDLKKDNNKLSLQNKRLVARMKVLEEQNQDLFKRLEEPSENE